MNYLGDFSYSVAKALISDLPDVEVKRSKGDHGETTFTRRPHDSEIEVRAGLQTWSSTALAFNGVGGQAFTSALTVIVSFENVYCIYVGRRLAYKIDYSTLSAEGKLKFSDDYNTINMASVRDAATRYKKELC